MDFLPGDPSNSNVNNLPALVAEITSTIDDAELVADETDAAIIMPIIEDIISAEQIYNDTGNDILGEIGVALDEAEQVLAKTRDKIIKEMEDLLSDAYMYMGQMGIPIPTDEDIAYSEATGDFLGFSDNPSPDVRTVTPQGECPPGSVPHYFGGILSGCEFPMPDGGHTSPPVVIDATMPGGSGGGNNGQCPPGHHWQPPTGGSVDSDAPTTGLDPSHPDYGRSRSESLLPCDPPLISGITQDYTPGPLEVFPSGTMWNPWFNKASHPFPPMTQCDNIWGCHFRPPRSTSVEVCYPLGYKLYYEWSSGTLIAANYHPAGYEEFIGVGTQNPSGGNGGGGGGGGHCVPDDPGSGVCPVPDTPCSPPGELPEFPSDEKKEDICQQIEAAIKNSEGTAFEFAKFFATVAYGTGSGTIAESVISAITGGNEPLLTNLLRRFVAWMQTTVEVSTNSIACDSPAMLYVTLKRAFLRFVDKWTDVIPDQALSATDQVSNTICQHILPTGSQADAAYLADEADEKLWECWHKAEGNYLDSAKKVLFSKRQRVNAREADILYRRKKIEFEDMRKRMKADGVIKDDDMFDIRELNQWWPTSSNLIPWMKRDVFDTEAVERGKLDEDFDKKFTGEAEKLADGAGIDAMMMKYEWRSHWHIPSYSMGREFLHRFNDPDLPENIRFDEQAFRDMLKQDDWAPGYIDRMIANAYHPVTRSDVVKAYMTHAIDDEQFLKRFKKTGYTQQDTEFYLEFYKKKRGIADKKGAGYPTLRTAVNAYARCEMAPSEFVGVVKKIAITEEQAQSAIDAADLSRQMWERKQAIRTIKKPYILGIYDDAKATTELAESDVEPGCVDELMKQWRRERMRRDKYLTAGQLCEMYERGILSPQDMVMALVRSGWGEQEAVLIATNCGAKVSEKMAQRARMEAEKQAREIRRLAKEQEKARRLAECGPPPCPKNRTQSESPVAAGQ